MLRLIVDLTQDELDHVKSCVEFSADAANGDAEVHKAGSDGKPWGAFTERVAYTVARAVAEAK